MGKTNDFFEYKVTVIVPVYNVEEYLRGCLDSLLAQTIDRSQMEVLLINDGSTDNSLQICYEYAQSYMCFKVFTKENEGLSATRNLGIKNAKGKYIMYLDSDDTLTPETIKNLVDFFDKHYDKVDSVTYPIQQYKENTKIKQHFRYKFLSKTGIYSLDDNPGICQTNINIITKNIENNILFDTTPHFRQEDQKYNCQILMKKMKIGFCKEAEYQYYRREDSITGTLFNPIEMFEMSLKYFEDLFNEYSDKVPAYFQMMYFSDLLWKLKANILFPYHYENEEWDNAISQLKALLDRVDNKIICSHPEIDNFHKVYWLTFKNHSNIIPYIRENRFSILSNTKEIYHHNSIELILYKVKLINNKFSLLLSAKSSIFSLTDRPVIYAIIKDKDKKEMKINMDIFESSYNYYHCKERTNSFWTFCFEEDITNISEIKFVVSIDGIELPTHFYYMNTSSYGNPLAPKNYIVNNISISVVNNVFKISLITNFEIFDVRKKVTEKTKSISEYIYNLRNKAISYKKSRPIWLYYDCKGISYDNAYYQFLHDIEKEDGIDRFYINANNSNEISCLFNYNILNNIVSFASEKHDLLFLLADKILTAYIEPSNIVPFKKNEIQYFRDIINYEIVYLQHGILHACLPWKYSPERLNVDKVVISSSFEINNFKRYGFREKDLIPCGMPRYDYMNKKAVKKNRILFAPTWRSYLIGLNDFAEWIDKPEKFVNSNFFLNIQKLFSSNQLINILNKNDLYIDFKIHPIFKNYISLFKINTNRINFTENSINNDEYLAFITDFSSFVFDFAYYNIPIIYFVPDMLEFKAGLNTYRKLDLPFEDAFGELTTTPEDAVNALKKIIENNFVPEKKYYDRMTNFYLPLDNCCERLYQYLIDDQNKN